MVEINYSTNEKNNKLPALLASMIFSLVKIKRMILVLSSKCQVLPRK